MGPSTEPCGTPLMTCPAWPLLTRYRQHRPSAHNPVANSLTTSTLCLLFHGWQYFSTTYHVAPCQKPWQGHDIWRPSSNHHRLLLLPFLEIQANCLDMIFGDGNRVVTYIRHEAFPDVQLVRLSRWTRSLCMAGLSGWLVFSYMQAFYCLVVHWANICMPPIQWYNSIREAACEDVANRFSYAICSIDQEHCVLWTYKGIRHFSYNII